VAGERLDAATALIDARLVWGDEHLFTDLRESLERRLRKDPTAFLRALWRSAQERRERHGSCSQLLEPDLKEGAGGLRDIHLVRWLGWALTGGRDVAAFSEGGHLRGRELAALDEAEEFFVRLRSALHLETGKGTDKVHFDHQPSLARVFGFEETVSLGAADALMATLFQHARHVEHVVELAFDRAFSLAVGAEGPPVEIEPPRSPDEVLDAFREAATTGVPLSPRALDLVEEADVGEAPFAWTAGGRHAFLEILGGGPAGSRALEALDRAGLLEGFLPEWGPVRCRPQRDPYHRYTVDVHLLQTVARASELLSGSAEDDRVALESAAVVADRDAVLLGALLHDIGKTGHGHHVPLGIEAAERALRRMGVRDETRGHVLFLVREHLLLADTATRRDLSEENLVMDVAARVETPERLAMLYLVTASDAFATGPHAWTPWRQTLIRELVAKTEHVLERGEMGTDRAETLSGREAAIEGLLAEEDQATVRAFLDRMPRNYFLAVDPEQAARHFWLVTPDLSASEVRTTVASGSHPGTYEVTVVVKDRPGLLAKIAGSLALSGLNILSAQAFTTEDRVAVDLFEIEPAFHGEVDEDRWRRVRLDLRKALEGRLSLEYRVRDKRRHYQATKSDVEPSVTVDNQASDFFTVVEVSAADRIGLLFDLARTFHELELDVHLAKVATYGGRVVDAFYVRNLFGEKVEDLEHRREIERAILARLREP
jgi:[protein-PII] uridylyltransferase